MKHQLFFRYFITTILILFPVIGKTQEPIPNPDPLRFQNEIAVFIEWDKKNSIPSEAILFVGSSSIRMWLTHEAFPKYKVINRGFGGAHISDIDYYYSQVIKKYNPKIIVYYCGDNDIDSGKSVKQVFTDYIELIHRIFRDNPTVKFIYLPIKPSLSRWSYWEKMKEVNRLIKMCNEKQDQLFYIDTASPMFDENGLPDKNLLLEDGLHLNKEGYKLWNRLLSKLLDVLN